MRVDYPGNVGENDCSTSLDPDLLGSAFFNRGPVAQLGARFHGMEEVAGSIPARSTNLPNQLDKQESWTACFRSTPRSGRLRPHFLWLDCRQQRTTLQAKRL